MIQQSKFALIFIWLLCGFCALIRADTPANCTYEDVIGSWVFQLSPKNITGKSIRKFDFHDLNLVRDEFGNAGKWTLIYNQGFEFTVNHMTYLAMFDFKPVGPKSFVSICNATHTHSIAHSALLRQWSALRGSKLGIGRVSSFSSDASVVPSPSSPNQIARLVNRINSANLSWTATRYSDHEALQIDQLIRMSGGVASKLQRPKASRITWEERVAAAHLPKSFDWRNVNGANYVSPVRAQLQCGSCYAFASAALLEARFRIRSGNTIAPVLSTQRIVDCSPYSQGCDGGFPYLIAGKFAQDFGFPEESCYPYVGRDGTCRPMNSSCSQDLFYATNYRYVGGFYGATNEYNMMLELVNNGPVAVGFEVYPEFKQYKSGVYHHTTSHQLGGLASDFNPFELTNHAVLVVGYGETHDGVKYWTVKNSWGTGWGMNGFFNIRRGNDECGIESLAVAVDPVF